MITLTPAWGRDYRWATEAKACFESGKDWILHDMMSPWDGKPTSIADFNPGDTVKLPFHKNTRVATYTLPKTTT